MNKLFLGKSNGCISLKITTNYKCDKVTKSKSSDDTDTEEVLKSDIVICTHNHLDHVDIDAIPLMKKDNMLFLAPSDAENTLLECGVVDFEMKYNKEYDAEEVLKSV